MKKYSIIVFWVLIYAGSIGFVLPYLFSEKSNWTVGAGVLLIIMLVYKLITFIDVEKIKNFYNQKNAEK
jgi:membrane protein YdbS with pleckstrin-like domain